MNIIKTNLEVLIPDTILNEFKTGSSIELVYENDTKIWTQVIHPSKVNIAYVDELITNKLYNNFMFLNKYGDILYENNVNSFNINVDENYYITVNKNNKTVVIHSSNDTFITSSTKENLNKSYQYLLKDNIIEKDITFNGNSFTNNKTQKL